MKQINTIVAVITLEIECVGSIQDDLVELDEALNELRGYGNVTEVNSYFDCELV